MRSKNHANQQIPEAGRDMQTLKRNHDGDRHSQKQDDLREIFHHRLIRER